MANKTVEVIIKAKDLTATVVANFQRRWRAMERVIRTVTRSIVAFTAAAVATTVGLQKLGQRGEEVNAVKRAFARITDDETSALDRLRRAAGGAISDFKLMSLANQAMALGAAKSVEQFAEMVEVSRALGRAQGIDALSALNSLTIGLARQSPRILDNIGIQIQLGDASTFAARAMEQARQKAEALSGGMQAGTDWATRFAAAMSNAGDRLATFVAESPQIAAFFDRLSSVVTDLVDIVTSDGDLIRDAFASLGRIAGNAFSAAMLEAVGAGGSLLSSILHGIENRIARALGMSQAELDRLRAANDAAVGGPARASSDAVGNIMAELEVLASLGRAARGRAALRAGSGGGGGGSGFSGFGGGETGVLAFPGAPALPSGMPADAVARFREMRDRRINPRFGMGARPEGGPVSALVGLSPEQQAAFDAQNEADTIRAASDQVKHAKSVVVASMFGMAQAAVRGSGQVAESVVGMITQIAQSLPGVGGFLGTVIGGVGGLIGAAFSRGRDRPVPVRLQEVDEQAAKTLQNSGEPIRITTIIESGGVEIERIERDLIDRSNRDETVRFSRGRAVGSIG